MCWKCHQGQSDKDVVEQLSGPDPKYDKWNTTSLSHMMIIGYGFNGEEAQKLAIQQLEGCYQCFLEKENNIISSITNAYYDFMGTEPMDSQFGVFQELRASYVKKILDHTLKWKEYFTKKGYTQCQIAEYLQSNMEKMGFDDEIPESIQ